MALPTWTTRIAEVDERHRHEIVRLVGHFLLFSESSRAGSFSAQKVARFCSLPPCRDVSAANGRGPIRLQRGHCTQKRGLPAHLKSDKWI